MIALGDGSKTFTVVVYDTLGNSTTVNYTINVALALPAVPSITQPANGYLTNQAGITVSGQAEKSAEVTLYNKRNNRDVVS